MKRYLPYLPALILTLGAILRVVTIGSSAIWFDEAVSLYRSTIPFMTLFSNGADQSGSLVLDLLLRLTTYFNHHSIILLRLPSLIAGLISLWLVWILMKKLHFTLEQQIATSLLVAFLPGLLWLGQDARPYGITACIILAALYFALDGAWLGLVACCGLTMYSHATAGLFAIGIFFIPYIYSYERRVAILSGIAIAISWVPAAVRIFFHGDFESIALQPWAAHLTGNWFVQSGLIALWAPDFGNVYFLIAAFILLAFTLPLILSNKKNIVGVTLALSWLLPLIIITIASLAWENVINYRTLMPLLFPFCLWLGWKLMERPVFFPKFLLGGSWAILLIVSLIIWRPAERGAYLDKVTAEVRSQFQPGDLLVYSTDTSIMATNFYLGDLPHYQWNVSSNTMLNGVLLSNTGDPSMARRIWLFTPTDILLTDQEETRIHSIIPTRQEPIYKLIYLQTPNIEIYLLDPVPIIK